MILLAFPFIFHPIFLFDVPLICLNLVSIGGVTSTLEVGKLRLEHYQCDTYGATSVVVVLRVFVDHLVDAPVAGHDCGQSPHTH